MQYPMVCERPEGLRDKRRALEERKRKLLVANSIATGLCFVGQDKLAAAWCAMRRTCSRPTLVSLNKVRTSLGLRRVSSLGDLATGSSYTVAGTIGKSWQCREFILQSLRARARVTASLRRPQQQELNLITCSDRHSKRCREHHYY